MVKIKSVSLLFCHIPYSEDSFVLVEAMYNGICLEHDKRTRALRTALFWALMQRVVIVLYQNCVTTYRSHLQGSRIQPNGPIFKGQEFPFKMEPKSYPETSVRNYHYSLRNNPEERSSHLLRGGSLKLRT